MLHPQWQWCWTRQGILVRLWGKFGLPWPGQRLHKELRGGNNVCRMGCMLCLCCDCCFGSCSDSSADATFSYLAWSYINSKLCCGSNKRWYKTDPCSWLPLPWRRGGYHTGCVTSVASCGLWFAARFMLDCGVIVLCWIKLLFTASCFSGSAENAAPLVSFLNTKTSFVFPRNHSLGRRCSIA